MILETPSERVKCRRCGTKLQHPTSNDRSAFCCRGCYRMFYRDRCLICEEPAKAKTCGRRPCRLELEGLRRHQMLGRYHTPTKSPPASANPIKIGVRLIGPDDVPINLIGGYKFPGDKRHLLPHSLQKESSP